MIGPVVTLDVVSRRLAYARARVKWTPEGKRGEAERLLSVWEAALAELGAGRPVTVEVLGLEEWNTELALQSAVAAPGPGGRPLSEVEIEALVRRLYEGK